MRVVALRVAVLLVSISLSYAQPLPKRCKLSVPERQPCGYPGIQEDYCYGVGCCYDDKGPAGAPWCYSGSNDRFLTNGVLTSLIAGGVPREVVFALYADVNEGAEWFLAFSGGSLDTSKLLQLIIGNTLNIPPLYANILAGEDPIKLILTEIGTASGANAQYLEYILDGKTEVVLKHILYLLSAQNINPSIPYSVVSDLMSGKPLDSSKLIENYASQLLPQGDKFQTEFYKNLFAGKTNEAIQWLYLSTLRFRIPLKGLYPKNTGVFAAIVRTQKDFPGLISPSIILALAKGEILPGLNTGGQTFEQLFGVPAKDYICAAHSPNLQTSCEKLRGRLFVTSQDCIYAGCCHMQPTAQNRQAVCFENILGDLGTFLATNVIDEHYINETILGGNLPSIEHFIPWIPNNELPLGFQNWLGGVPPGKEEDNAYFIEKYPTAAPLGPSRLRPGFQWRPHGPTAFPFNPKLPYDLLVPTEEPGVINPYPDSYSSSGPLVGQMNLNGFNPVCRAVQKLHRVQCISNSDALSSNGASVCASHDCCYDPDYSDLTVPACFRRVEYGQCYKVLPEEREECGRPGIKREQCLENPQCCYDTTLTIKQMFDQIPWCYYKKRSPLLSKDVCTRVSSKVACFSNANINAVVAKETCEAFGCCFDYTKPSYFDIAIGREESNPYCYKPGKIDLRPTEEPDAKPGTEEKCQFSEELEPHKRVDCGPKTPFACRYSGCCYEAVNYLLVGIPRCFKKSVL